MDWHIAEINVARLRAPIDDPLVAEFVDALVDVNALAEGSPGFVWRLQTPAGDATGIQAFDDELIIVNMSVWASIEALADYVYRTVHTDFLRRKREWFERLGTAHAALWWVPAGSLPSVEDGTGRLDVLRQQGPTARAFTFAHRFDPAEVATGTDVRDTCPA